MYLSAVVCFLSFHGAVLCCLPACLQVTTCNITSDKSVYAFPSNIWTDWSSTSSSYFMSFKVTLHLDQYTLEIAGSRKSSVVEFELPRMTLELRSCATEQFSNVDNYKQTANLTADVRCIYERYNAVKNYETATITFHPQFEYAYPHNVWCEVTVSWAQDYAPSVLFKTALKVSPRKLMTSTAEYLNETSDNVVELKINNTENEVAVYLQVNDNDFFVDNDDQLEFCAVSEPNITLSAVVTFHNFSKMSNSSTPYNLPLATDDGLNQKEGAWWKKNSSRVNETLIDVHLDFVVSALCAAINGLLGSSGHLPLDAYSVDYVNITLNVTATSGTTNPQQSNGKLTLVLVFEGECILLGATAQSYTVTTEQNLITIKTAHSDTATTANDATGTINLLVVGIGVTFSVLVMSVLIASLAVKKYRAHLLRLKTASARPLVDDSIFRFNLKNTQIYAGPSSLQADQYR